MWRASVLVLVACGSGVGPSTEIPTTTATREPSPAAARAVTPAIVSPIASIVERMPEPVEPPPFAPDPPDDGTTAGAVRIPHPIEVAIPYTEEDVLEVDDLPPTSSAWKRRSTVPYEGFVPITFTIIDGRLRMNIAAFDGPVESIGRYRGFDLTWTDDAAVLDQFDKLNPPNIHALIAVRPTVSSPDSDRVHVAVYTPPDEHVVLVATRRDVAKRWRPLLRVDAPKATTFALYFSDLH